MDILSEQSRFISPYQYGFNNPVFYNDPSGALTRAEFENVLTALSNSTNGGSWSASGGGSGSFAYGGGSVNFYGTSDEGFGMGAAYMALHGMWGAQQGWASSFQAALNKHSNGQLTAGIVHGVYSRLWAESGGYNVSAHDRFSFHLGGSGFSVGFNFNSSGSEGAGELTDVGVGGLFVTRDAFMSMMGAYETHQARAKTLGDLGTSLNLAGTVPLAFVEGGFRWAGAASGLKSFSGAKSFLGNAANVAKGTRVGLGIVTTGLSAIEGLTNPDGWQKHNTIDVITGGLSIAFPVFGAVYGVLDLGTVLFTGKGISQHIENALED